ncbi:hypothetical protein ACQSSU_20870 [Micromonospora echinospora]
MNLTDATKLLEQLRETTTADVEDARAALSLATEDLGRFDRFSHSMVRLFGPGGAGVDAAGQLAGRAQQRRQAATDRARHAESTNALAGTFITQLAQHLAIRERGQAAGGLAQREAYGAGPNRQSTSTS